MEKINKIFKWIFQNFFLLVIIALIIIYARWFWLMPIAIHNLFPRLLWFVVFGFIAMILKTNKGRTNLGKFLFAIMILFIAVNLLYIYFFMPKIVESAKYNDTTYYIVSDPNHLDPPWTTYYLTRWQGFFEFNSRMVSTRGGLELRCDEKRKVVSVVKVFSSGYERLIILDDEPPVIFNYGNDVEFEGKRYYLSDECNQNPENPYDCKSLSHRIYQCELDNTLCSPLPFQYMGGPVWDISVENAVEANQLYIYFYLGSAYANEAVLIFSYSDNNPRCYVEGCEILISP